MNGVLEQILDTLKRIEEKLGSTPAATAPAATATAAAPAEQAPARKPRGRAAAAAAPAAPAAPPAEPGVADDGGFLDEPSSSTPPLTKDDVRSALIAYNKKVNSEAKTRELLKTAGDVDNLSALPEEKYAAVIAATRA